MKQASGSQKTSGNSERGQVARRWMMSGLVTASLVAGLACVLNPEDKDGSRDRGIQHRLAQPSAMALKWFMAQNRQLQLLITKEARPRPRPLDEQIVAGGWDSGLSLREGGSAGFRS